jgi:hypothetical protein
MWPRWQKGHRQLRLLMRLRRLCWHLLVRVLQSVLQQQLRRLRLMLPLRRRRRLRPWLPAAAAFGRTADMHPAQLVHTAAAARLLRAMQQLVLSLLLLTAGSTLADALHHLVHLPLVGLLQQAAVRAAAAGEGLLLAVARMVTRCCCCHAGALREG